MLPSPPTMTMVKERSVKSGAKAGVASSSRIMSVPATPAQAAPIPKVRAKSRLKSSPTTAAPTRLSAEARIAVPRRERRKKTKRASETATATRAA